MAMGIPSPRELMRRLSPSELGLWAAKWLVDPWGGQRSDVGHAVVAHVAANAWMKKAGGGSYTPADFMPFRFVEQSPAEKAAALSRRLRAALQVVGKTTGAKK